MAEMFDNIENGEEKRSDNFSKVHDNTQKLHDKIKELLISTTESELEKLGFEKNDKIAGVYGDGTTYGRGVEEEKYSVTVTARPRKFNSSMNKSHGYGNGTFEKQIIIGTKRLESQVDFEIKNGILHLQYRSPEAMFFRGHDVRDTGETFMVRKKISIPIKDIESTLKKEFKDAAYKEIGYITNTKLGVEDRLDASTTSIVENINMKKLTLKSIFEDDLDFSKSKINESDDFKKLPSDEHHINAHRKLNQINLANKNGDLLFDDVYMEDLFEELKENEGFIEKLKSDYGTKTLSDLSPAEKTDFFNSLKTEVLDEITMATPAGASFGAGAGRYDTKYFAKAIGRKFASRKGSKDKDKTSAGAPFNISAEHPFYESENLKESYARKVFKETAYAKSQAKRPKIDKDYNIIPEKNTNASKPYTQVVKIDTETHPLGMPFIKPNSKEELERTSGIGRDHDKLKRMGLNESEKDRVERLRKKRFNSIVENENKGINKRYIITEKTSEEYEKERWAKLTSFSKFETIKEAEELNSTFDNIDDYDSLFFKEDSKMLSESFENKTNNNEEKTIEVEKPGSVFGITQKFYEKDFLNESKNFILDLNSKVFVKNPNAKK